MKLYNSISAIGLTVLSFFFSSVAYSNNSALIHSSPLGLNKEPLIIYKIKLTLNLGSRKDIFTKSHYIKLYGVNGNTTDAFGYKDTTIWSEPVAIGSLDKIHLVIPNLVVTQDQHVDNPSIQLSGEFYSTTDKSDRLCYFKYNEKIQRSSLGFSQDNVLGGDVGGDDCRLKLDSFEVLVR